MHKILLVIFSSLFAVTQCVLAQETTVQTKPASIPLSRSDSFLTQGETNNNNSLSSLIDFVKMNQSLPSEKIYLHLDRTGFLQGDTIWFRGYSWYGYEQIPDTVSKVLYVDLLDSKGKCRLSKKLLIHEGLSEGDFTVDTTLSPGTYIIRAYTQWMKNLNTGDPFSQNILIRSATRNFQIECRPAISRISGRDSLKLNIRFLEIDPDGNLKSTYKHRISYNLKVGDIVIDSGQIVATNTIEQIIKKDLSGIEKNQATAFFEVSVNDARVAYKKRFEIPLRDGIDIQFFPEGGSFINGVNSRLAFKAIGPDGLSREAKGVIESKEGNVICDFESVHKGMGSFFLKPQPDKQYFAHLLYNNRNYYIPLPGATDNGCVMTIKPSPPLDDPLLSIKCSQTEINTTKYITGSTNGKILFSARVKLANDSCGFRVPLIYLPDGICRLTLLSSEFKPQCERLVYIDKDDRFAIEIKTDSSYYGTRSKVSLQILTRKTDGTPVSTDLSLAVVDKEFTENNITVNDISAYKLLESELKGKIEEAGYYFENGNCNDPESLDLLLLTHGYRSFPAAKPDQTDQKYLPETSINLSGNLLLNGSKRRAQKFNYHNITLTFLCPAGKTIITNVNPDSLGKFSLQIPLVYGRPQAMLQAKTTVRRKFNGEIFLDETLEQPKFPIVLSTDLNIALPEIESIRQVQASIKTTLTKDPAYGYMTKNLPEVVVSARAPNWYENYEKEAIKIADLDSLDPTGNKYESLTDLLVREFEARVRIIPRTGMKVALLPSISVMGPDHYFPIYVINNNVWFDGMAKSREEFLAKLSYVSDITVNQIKKLMVLEPGEISYHYANKDLAMEIQQSLVVIETYEKGFRGDPQGIKTLILEGLDAPRQFYSLKYDSPPQDRHVYDGRTTLHWEPSVKTDSTGYAKIEFYTSDRKSPFEVNVNGIIPDTGSPGQGHILINSGRGK